MSLSRHVRERMKQRKISREDIETVVHFGRRANHAGCHIYLLTAVDTCRAGLPRSLAGLVVVVGHDGGAMTVVTTYRKGILAS